MTPCGDLARVENLIQDVLALCMKSHDKIDKGTDLGISRDVSTVTSRGMLASREHDRKVAL